MSAPPNDLPEDLDAALREELLSCIEAAVRGANEKLGSLPVPEALSELLALLAGADSLGLPAMARVARGLEGALRRASPDEAGKLALRALAVLRAQLDDARGGTGYECVASFFAALEDHGAELPPMEPGAPAGALTELLLASGGARAEHVALAREAQRRGDGRPLGEILLSVGQVDAGTLGDLLALELAAREAQEAAGRPPLRAVTVRSLERALQGLDAAARVLSGLPTAGRDALPEGLDALRVTLEEGVEALGSAAAEWGYVSAEGLLSHATREGRAAARRCGVTAKLTHRGAASVRLDATLARALGGPLGELVRHAIDQGATALALAASPAPGSWRLRVEGAPSPKGALERWSRHAAVVALGAQATTNATGDLLLDLPRGW